MKSWLLHLLRLDIKDSGQGISKDVIQQLGIRGSTFGKENGRGLGVYHARCAAERWGGSLRYESTIGAGTTAIFTLPSCKPPAWFAAYLDVKSVVRVVVLDDDRSIHQVWAQRFSSHADVPIVNCFSPTACERYPEDKSTLYLVDYEFRGNSETGLDFIKRLPEGSDAILVTSRFEDPAIVQDCAQAEIKLLPKSLAPSVPIYSGVVDPSLDAVLLDDDLLVHDTWQFAAIAKKKQIKLFSEPHELLAYSGILPKNTPIYIDALLPNGIRGETIALELHRQGFEFLHLATGLSAEELHAKPDWLALAEKDPPF